MGDPLVSILIPCYNAERWIGESIESALAQTYPHTEIIVLDDGSSDGSLDVIKSFGEKISWEKQENQGGNVARNRLLEKSKGEWIQYLDADDKLLPDKIEKQVTELANLPETDLIFGPVTVELWEEGIPRNIFYPIEEPRDDPWLLMFRWQLPQTNSPLWRKKAIEDVGAWNINQPCCQEHELYLRLLKSGKIFTYFDDPGTIYRWHEEGSISRSNESRTYKERLRILRASEEYLRETGDLSALYQDKLADAYLSIARRIWVFDQEWAKDIEQQMRTSHPEYVPKAEPKLYCLLYRCFGFHRTEQIALFKRRLQNLRSEPKPASCAA